MFYFCTSDYSIIRCVIFILIFKYLIKNVQKLVQNIFHNPYSLKYIYINTIEVHFRRISSISTLFFVEFQNSFADKFTQTKIATFDRDYQICPIRRPLRNHYGSIREDKWCVKVRARRSFSRSERIFGCHNHVAIFFLRPYNYGEQPT